MMSLYNREQVLEAYVHEQVEAAAEAATKTATIKERENGIARLIDMCKEFGLSLADTIAKIAASYSLSISESAMIVQKYW